MAGGTSPSDQRRGFDGVSEHDLRGGGAVKEGAIEPCEEGMAVPIEVTLGVGHQTEDAAGGIANPRYVGGGAVGIIWMQWGAGAWLGCDWGVTVPQGDLPTPLHLLEHVRRIGDDATFAMGNGEHHGGGIFAKLLSKTARPDADARWLDPHGEPAIDESTVEVVGEAQALGLGLLGPGFLGGRPGKQARLHGDLEAIADCKDGAPTHHRFAQGWVEGLAEAKGKDPPAGDVIAITESAWQANQVELIDHPRVIDDGLQMAGCWGGSCLAKGPRQFNVAIGTWGAEDECFAEWCGHACSKRMSIAGLGAA